MAQANKILQAALVASIITLAAILVLTFMTLQKQKSEKALLQNELAATMKEKNKISQELEELKVVKADLEMKLSGVEAQAKLLAESYEKEKSEKESAKNDLQKAKTDLKTTQSELETAKNEKQGLQELLDKEKERYNQLKDRVDKLVEAKNVLEEKVRDIVSKQGIELERIVVKAEGELEGKIVVVNRDYNFVVADLGSDDNVELGDSLTIFRAGKYVGEAQVEKIYDTMSAAAIVKEIKPKAIAVDDSVIVKGK